MNRLPRINVPPKAAVLIATIWGTAIGATTQLGLPSWAQGVIALVGVILAALHIIPEYPSRGSTNDTPTGGPWA